MMLKGYGVGNNVAGILSAVDAGGFRARHGGTRLNDVVGDREARAAARRVHAPATTTTAITRRRRTCGSLLRHAYDEALQRATTSWRCRPFPSPPRSFPTPTVRARSTSIARSTCRPMACPLTRRGRGHPAFAHSVRHEGRSASRPDAESASFRGKPPAPGGRCIRSEETIELQRPSLPRPRRRRASVSRISALSRVAFTEAILQRIDKLDRRLKSYATVTPELALDRRREADAETAGRLSRAAARRADRGEGSLQHRGRADRRRHGDPPPQCRPRTRRSWRVSRPGGRGDPGQAADDRGRLRPHHPTIDRRRSIPGTRPTGPAPRRRARAWRPRPASASPRWAPIPAARSAFPRP